MHDAELAPAAPRTGRDRSKSQAPEASSRLHMSTLAIGFGWQEILIILVILLVLFGGKKLPELARAMGNSITQFKRGLSEDVPGPNDRIEGGERGERTK